MSDVYTDSPPFSANPIWGSLQLLLWFFAHPSAWRNHISKIDSTIRADFAFADLSIQQSQNQWINKAIIRGFVFWPVLGTVIALFFLHFFGHSANRICLLLANDEATRCFSVNSIDGILFGLGFGLMAGMLVGWTVSAVFGMVIALFTTMLSSIAWGAANIGGLLISYGVIAGLAGGVASSLTDTLQIPFSRTRQISGGIIGAAIGVIMFGMASRIPVLFVQGSVNSGSAFRIYGIVFGILSGVSLGAAMAIHTRRWFRSLFYWTLVGAVIGPSFGFLFDRAEVQPLFNSVVLGVQTGVAGGVLFALPYALGERIAGANAGATAAALAGGGGGITAFVSLVAWEDSWSMPGLIGISAICIIGGLTINLWRPILFYPLTLLWGFSLYRAEDYLNRQTGYLLHWHPAFWDEHQYLPLPGLDEHLIRLIENRPLEGQIAIEYLSTGHQRWAARSAQIELDARYLERLTQIESLTQAHRQLAAGELEGPASALLRSFSHISQDIEAALNQISTYHQRLALKAISDSLNGLLRELNRSHERYAPRFRPTVVHWQHMVDEHIAFLVKSVELRQEIDNPYIIGIPLTAHQEIFVGRTDISWQIENLLLDRRRPPLLLYGQRRMGKTSLLNNLGRLLPKMIIPLFVDLQGPVSYASDHAGLFYNMARSMIHSAEKQRNISLPLLSRDALTADPFTTFDEWLDKVEAALPQQTILLALDEFEALDSGFREGRFNERAILSMLRHIIQHRLKFKILLAGSHAFDEFQRWSSYLINAQVIPISYLSEQEAYQLMAQPVKDFVLRYLPQAQQRIIQLTRGHPFLLQLLCGEIVALKNEQAPKRRRIAAVTDVEAAVPRALSRGSMFFADIEQNQVSPVTLPLLQLVAQEDEGVKYETLTQYAAERACDLEKVLTQLFQRELVEVVGEVYRFQVELVRLWFRHRLSFSRKS